VCNLGSEYNLDVYNEQEHNKQVYWSFENLYILKFLLISTELKIFMAESRILNILMLFAVCF